MPPAVGGGIRYMTVGGVVGAGCIPLPVPETHPDLYEIAPRESYPPSGVRYPRRNRYNFDGSGVQSLDVTDLGNGDLYISATGSCTFFPLRRVRLMSSEF